MRLLPLLPNLQQLELTGVNIPVEPDEDVTSTDQNQELCLQQLREHAGITRLTLNFTITRDFKETREYSSRVASLLLHSACPQQLQDLTLRWRPGNAFPPLILSIHVRQLAHLKQLRKLTLDQLALHIPHAPEDAEVNGEVVGRLEQVKLLFPEVNFTNQQLDSQGLPALLPKLVELHATRQTFTEAEVLSAATNLTSIRVGRCYSLVGMMPENSTTDKLFQDIAALQQLRKLVLPDLDPLDPDSMRMFARVTELEQLQDLRLEVRPQMAGAVQILSSLQHLTSLSLRFAVSFSRFDPKQTGALWQQAGLSRLCTLKHLAVEGDVLAAAPPAALEALTRLTGLSTSFAYNWQQYMPRITAMLKRSPALQQRLRVMYATVVRYVKIEEEDGVRKVYRALRRALPRTRVEVCVGGSVPGWLREAA
jgi:hypothetical protein